MAPAQAGKPVPPKRALTAADTQALRDQAAQQLLLCKAEAQASPPGPAQDWANACYAAAFNFLSIDPTTQPPITATPPSSSPSASPTTLPPTTVPPSSSPTPSPTTQPNECMPVPHVCGFPDATNTGVQPGQNLLFKSGTVHVAAGQTLSNTFINGDISVDGNNAHLINVRLVMTNPDYGIRIFNRSGVTLSHVEIDMNHMFNAKAVAFDGYAADHLWVHNGADCAHLGDHASVSDSFCSLGPDGSTSLSWCNSGHIDGFQTDGGTDQTYRHNTIRNPCGQTSAIAIDSDQGQTTNVHIVDNLMAGGGYTVYCNSRNVSPNPTVEFSGNRFARTYYANGGFFGPLHDTCPAGPGNVWDETGLAVG
jgi:hypothetical protein